MKRREVQREVGDHNGDVELQGVAGSSQQPRPQVIGAPTAVATLPTPEEAVEVSRLPGRKVLRESSAPWTREQYLSLTGYVVKVMAKVVGVGFMLALIFIAMTRWPSQAIEDHSARSQLLSALFVAGLTLVALEDILSLNKSSVMMVLAASMWAFVAVGYHPIHSKVGARQLHRELNRGLQEVGSVILFLLPAMGVVESIDHFDGFAIVTLLIRKSMGGHKGRLMPIIGLLTFTLSSVIDNLTATIVALKLLRHLVPADEEWRRNCGGMAVIAANAGGAWSPIGDVTTSMLWISGKISAGKTIAWLLLPSFAAGFLPLAGIWWQASAGSPATAQKKDGKLPGRSNRHFLELKEESADASTEELRETQDDILSMANSELLKEEVTAMKVIALVLGIALILLVPTLKAWTGLPPYLGMILALGLFWMVTDALDLDAPEGHGSQAAGGGSEGAMSPGACSTSGPALRGVCAALHKVDLTGLLFFTGVLLAVGALDSAGVLRSYARLLVRICGPSPVALCALLGVSSAVVDNVPLVEASIDMFREKGCDDPLWQLVALAAGTGGSILSIGSVAGVTLMSMEGVGFLWYWKNISLWATLGFAMGIAVYQVEYMLMG